MESRKGPANNIIHFLPGHACLLQVCVCRATPTHDLRLKSGGRLVQVRERSWEPVPQD